MIEQFSPGGRQELAVLAVKLQEECAQSRSRNHGDSLLPLSDL